MTLFFQVNKTENATSNEQTNAPKNNNEVTTNQSTASQNSEEQSNKQSNNDINTVTANNNSTQNNNEVTTPTKNDSEATNSTTDKKQETKPDLSTFPGLSLFFTDVKANTANASAQTVNDDNRKDQTNVDGKAPAATLTSAENSQTIPATNKQTELIKAASNLAAAINKGTAYENSAAFNKMTAAKQKQLRDAIQAGKDLMIKYNAMQVATDSAALNVDQNNKNKADTKVNNNFTALNTLAVNGDSNTSTDTSSANATVTAPELNQAAQSIVTLLGADPVGTKTIDATTDATAWTDFVNAMEDSTTTTINIKGTLAPSTNTGNTQISVGSISKTINGTGTNGIGNNLLNLDQYTFTVANLNRPTDLTINNIDINGINTIRPTFDSFDSIILNNVNTKNAVNFANIGVNPLQIKGNSTINFTMNHTMGINALFVNSDRVDLGGYSDRKSNILINCKPTEKKAGSSAFYDHEDRFSPYLTFESGKDVVNIDNVENAFDGQNIDSENFENSFLTVGKNTDRVFSLGGNPQIPDGKPTIRCDDSDTYLDFLDNAINPDLSSLEIKTYLGSPANLTIHTDKADGFGWGGLTDLNTTNNGSNMILIYQKIADDKLNNWAIAKVANNTNLADPTNVQTNVTLSSIPTVDDFNFPQITNSTDISTKGYTKNNYYSEDKDTLVNYVYSTKFKKIEMGKKVAPLKTDAGRYDAYAADQSVSAGESTLPDPESILTIKDSSSDNDPKQDIATLKSTPDNFDSSKKIIQSINWVPNQYLQFTGMIGDEPQFKTGGIVGADGKINTANLSLYYPTYGLIDITYGDGTEKYVPVTFNPVSDAVAYHNEWAGKTIDVMLGTPVYNHYQNDAASAKLAKEALIIPSDISANLKDAISYSWDRGVDTSTTGYKPSLVDVTYNKPTGDDSVDQIPVLVHVIDEATEYAPTDKIITTTVGTTNLDPRTGIDHPELLEANKDSNDATKSIINKDNGGYAWLNYQQPDLSEPGVTSGAIKVTYSDGSTAVVYVPIIVNGSSDATKENSKYTPMGQDITEKYSSGYNATVPESDAIKAIANAGKLTMPNAADVKYTWATAPVINDLSRVGDQLAVVKVTYLKDNSVDYVPVVVHVTSDASDSVPPEGQVIYIDNGHNTDTTDAQKAIINSAANGGNLSSDITYSMESSYNILPYRDGIYPDMVKLTYPDQSYREVPIIVVVRPSYNSDNTSASHNEPVGYTIDKNLNEQIKPTDAKEAINYSKLFDYDGNTKLTTQPTVSWLNADYVDTLTETTGLKQAQVLLTYADQSKQTAIVWINVTSAAQRNKLGLKGKVINSKAGDTVQASDGIATNPGSGNSDFVNPLEINKIPNSNLAKYTVQSTPGTYPETIKVTYGDNSTNSVMTH